MTGRKRIVFVNLHSDWMLVKTASVYIFKYSAAVKHGYLMKYLLEHPEYEICNYINDRGFSWLRNNNAFLMKILNLFRFAENSKTMKINRIDPKKITVLKHASEIRKDDLVILYNICADNYRGMDGIHAFKALSMLHFHGTAGESDVINRADVSCLFGEVDLQKNCELYRRYYHVDKPWVTHPFVYAERFQSKVPFKERKNMAFATGTITYKQHDEFLNTYGDSCDQPTRKQIKDNPEFFRDTIYCTSSDYLEDDAGKKVNETDFCLIKLYKKVYNRTHVGKQKKYYSFDMVESFNSYKMCIVGEEILGIPGIGFVEGMACGCAYIGQDIPAYRDWGLIPGVHYITYDGTKEDLKRVIEHYQMDEHQAELEEIAKTGCEYVRSHFNGDAVAENLLKQLEEKQREWLNGNKV
ncbi:glycosyltransferase [uncultured Flavonifractor sp.]|uniref:glycosyltransferase n=1 Tax=uncultured Flavonifractor sp. TaxID=1193534 RepID=UPI002604672C|nr:glycosyltransferase [uncultured Flavonifractor sp.]